GTDVPERTGLLPPGAGHEVEAGVGSAGIRRPGHRPQHCQRSRPPPLRSKLAPRTGAPSVKPPATPPGFTPPVARVLCAVHGPARADVAAHSRNGVSRLVGREELARRPGGVW